MAPADSGVKPLQNAMKMAKVAIQLDAGNKHKEAYCEYLRTISFISHVLLEAAESQNEKDVEVPEVEVSEVGMEVGRMLRLAEQCLERAKSFIGKSSAPPNPSSSTSAPYPIPVSSPGQSQHEPIVSPPAATAAAHTPSTSDSPVDTRPVTSSPINRHSREGSDGGGAEHSPFVPPEVFQRLQTAESNDQSKKELTPIEEASRLNQKLKASYEARVARLSPGQAYQKTSLVSVQEVLQGFTPEAALGTVWVNQVLGDLLPDLDQDITELLDSLRTNIVDGPKHNVPEGFC